jgi:hypothetical protein
VAALLLLDPIRAADFAVEHTGHLAVGDAPALRLAVHHPWRTSSCDSPAVVDALYCHLDNIVNIFTRHFLLVSLISCTYSFIGHPAVPQTSDDSRGARPAVLEQIAVGQRSADGCRFLGRNQSNGIARPRSARCGRTPQKSIGRATSRAAYDGGCFLKLPGLPHCPASSYAHSHLSAPGKCGSYCPTIPRISRSVGGNLSYILRLRTGPYARLHSPRCRRQPASSARQLVWVLGG